MSAHVNPLFPDLPTGWMRDAACKGHGDLFWPPKGGYPGAEARAICEGCPVREDCLAYARALPEAPDGVWGGLRGGGRS